MTPDQLERHEKEVERQVFGDGFRRADDGKPLEQGVGSKGNESINHFRALKDAELKGYEPPGSYDKAVAEIWGRDPKRAKAIGLIQPRPPAAAKKA